MNSLGLLCLLLSTMSPRDTRAATKDDAYRLRNYLFETTRYKKDVRPASDFGSTTYIYMAFSLVSLVEVNEKSQELVTNARIELDWDDYLLSWDPNDYGNITTFVTKQDNVWLPDIVVDNSVTTHKQIGYKELPVRITSDGTIIWSPTILVKTSCSIVVTYYPFDTQVCSIDYATVLSTYDEIDVNIDETNPVLTNEFSIDGSWELIDYSAKNQANQSGKTKISFTLLLKRRTTFYVVNIILPVLFLSMTAALVFALPADSGEKMGTSITVLLAYAVYLTIVTAYLPNTSLQTSVLSLYLTILLGYTALTVVMSVFVLCLHHKPQTDPVGSKTMAITLFLKKITCFTTNNTRYHTKENAISPSGESRSADADKRHSDPTVHEKKFTWQIVSKTVDWFLFLVFVSLVILTTVICMSILTIGGHLNAPVLNKNV